MTKAADNLDKKIEAQLEKLKQLKARKQAVDARERSKEKEQERKNDTRRKILIGSMFLKKMKNDQIFALMAREDLDQFLTENRDRKLFDLPDIEA
jgi:hypothetical protein